MANAYKSNVIRVDTDAQFDGHFRIKYIKCVGGGVSIKETNSSGEVIYEGASGDFDEVQIHVSDGMYVDVTGGKTYIYLDVP